ncbi:MAG: hypothetical protein HBSAPP03_14370 [Phycisphaerae bacterium]|nr:MAG: hypothetical protein HBSAPP03_14370 [Phycisphaerae bacterium]
MERETVIPGSSRRLVWCGLCVCCVVALPGCLSRRVSITSEPSGATVWMNDVEVGRTPVQASFLYYGTYDVRVEHEGYEVLRTRARARTPIYEYPPADLAASAVPGAESIVKWHFVLEPSLEHRLSKEDLETGLIERARTLRGQVQK